MSKKAHIAYRRAQRRKALRVVAFAAVVVVVLAAAAALLVSAFSRPALPALSGNVIDIAASMDGFDKQELRVKVGQPVTITLDAIQGSQFEGTVSDIAPVGTTTGGSVNFTVTVEIKDKNDQIRPGMTAAANIAVNQLKDVLVVPNRAIRTQNGKRVIWVARNGLPKQIDITLGASSNTTSQVVGGDLKDGDQIILNPPSTSNPFGPDTSGPSSSSGG